jgi:hypothetical protein
MDLIKLVAELREYRAQVQEAIAALEDLARRRHPTSSPAKTPAKRPVGRPRSKTKPAAAKKQSS